MASSHNANTPGFHGKGTARIVSSPTLKQDEGVTGNIKFIRLLFIYCFVYQIFNAYRAYEIYQDFDSWVSLSRKDKVLLAWGVISAVVVPFFTAAYIVLEYRRRQMGGKR